MKASQNILVALLFFGALLMISFFTIISDSGPFASSGKQLVVFFDNAEGIKTGSKVTVIGVPAGLVESVDIIAVDKDKRIVTDKSPNRVSQRVAVTIGIRRNLTFYENYSIDIKNASLLGGRVVSIDPGSSIETIQKRHANGTIREEQRENQEISVFSTSATSFSGSTIKQLIEKGKDSEFIELQGKATGDPIGGFAELISENRVNVREAILNMREITDKINTGQGTLGQLVNDDDLHRNAVTLISDAQIVARELRENLEDQREQAPVNSFIRAWLTAF